MEPTFKVNAFILAEKVPYQEINIGDIIANQTEQYDKWVVHRVIDKKMVNGKTIALMTKGDNNELVDVQGATADSYKFKVIWHTNAFVPLITVLFGTLTNIKIKILKIGISILIVFVTGGLVGKQFWILINQIMKGAKSHDNNK
jgi:signal peptidase I